ncbi:MAG: hypothetical protein HC897_09410 [Thermoanaerobaculia bacterium]|nr:hypothetical protein [Thermoanaerobaculia bacterium]
MSSESGLMGGWSLWNFTLSPEAKKVFEHTVGLLRGVNYTPLAFATQVVDGLNYCFLCKGQVVVPEQPQFAVLIYVWAPPGGEPHITHIKRINPGRICGP